MKDRGSESYLTEDMHESWIGIPSTQSLNA